MKILSVGLFGVLGVLARYGIGVVFQRETPLHFPWGTFFINLAGSFLIGVVYVLGTEKNLIPAPWRVGMIVGFLGGFTTFSAYSLETALLLEGREFVPAVLYFSLSAFLGLAATLAGFYVTRIL